MRLLALNDQGTGAGGIQPTKAVDFNKLKEAFDPGTLLRDPNLTIGSIVSKALTYVFVIAGLVLLFMLISGGFQMIVGASNPKAKESAGKTITSAIVGFIIIFVAYWIVQIIQIVLGISVLK